MGKRRMKNRKRGRRPILQVVLSEGKVTYTCPSCFTRQTHHWYGREDHHCNHCGKVTNIKGETPVPQYDS